MTHAEGGEARAAGNADARNREGKLAAASRPGERTAVLDPGPPRRPRLKQAIEVFPASDGKVYLLRGEAIGDFAVDDEPHARTLLTALDGSRSVEGIAALVTERHPAISAPEVAAAVDQLVELGIAEDAAGDDTLEPRSLARFDRQLRYFGELVEPGRSRAEPQRLLEESTVVVLGLGGLGTWAAYGLASAGVGRLDLIDGDCVELSNLNRQILYAEEDLGKPKAPIAAAQLRRFNPALDIRADARRLGSLDGVRGAVKRADLVVDAADWPAHELERWVTTACFELDIPFITMSQLPPLGRVGPLFVPGETGCYFCIEADCRASHPLYDELAAGQSLASSPAATFGPMCGVIGAHVATDVVHFLTGLVDPSTYGRALNIDFRTMEITRDQVPARPGCPVCRGGRYASSRTLKNAS